jgi:O-antigen ligase
MIPYTIFVGLIALIVCPPVAVGSVYILAYSALEILVFFLLLLHLWSTDFSRLRMIPASAAGPAVGSTSSPFRVLESRFPILDSRRSYLSRTVLLMVPLFLFLLVGLFQLVPLPWGLLKILSPETAALYGKLGFSSGFLPLSQSVYSTTTSLLQWGAYVAIFALVTTFSPSVTALRNGRWIVAVVSCVFAIALLEAVYGLYSGLNRSNTFLWFDRPTGATVISGTWINPDHFAGFINMAIFCSLGLFAAYLGQSRRTGRRMRKALIALASSGNGAYLWFLALGLLVMIVASIFSVSRMGHASLLVGFVLVVIAYSLRRLNVLALILIVVMGGAVLWAGWKGLDPAIARWEKLDTEYWARLSIWTGAVDISRRFPAFGSGLGTFELAYAPYEPDTPGATVAVHAHNDYLETISEAGLAGFIPWVVFFALFLYSSIRLWLSRRSAFVRGIGAGGLAATVAMLTHSFADFNLQIPSNALLLFIIMGLTWRTLNSEFREKS